MPNKVKSEVKIGKKLKLCRETLKPKKTQQEIANDLGIQRTYLSDLERDKGLPGYDLLVRFADYFGTTLDYFFGRHEKTILRKQSLSIATLSVREEEVIYTVDSIQEMIWLMRDLPEEKQKAIVEIAKVVKGLSF